jgi:hypothetical protein
MGCRGCEIGAKEWGYEVDMTEPDARIVTDEESFRAYVAEQPFQKFDAALGNLVLVTMAPVMAALERLVRWLGLRLP